VTAAAGAVRLAAVSDAVYPWHRGGKELRYHELLGRMPARGVDVDLYTMRWWAGDPPAGAVAHHAICRRMDMYRGGRRTISQGIGFAASTLRLLRVPRPDVVEADHMPYLQLFPLALVCRLRRVPLVVTWHEVWGADGWAAYLPGMRGRIAARIERAAMSLPDIITAVSPDTASRLVAAGADARRVRTVCAGVRAAEIRATPADPGAPDILCVGRLISHKRADLVLRALALLPEATAGFVGDGPERAALERLAAETGVASRVRFYGQVESDADVFALLRGARVLAAPSEREGYGLSVAEALAAGTPVATSDHPDNGARSLVAPGLGEAVPAGDAAALAAALRRQMALPHDEAARAARAAAFDAAFPDLSWDAAADAYAAVLREVAR
jgi:glycosyltransferase involved in cell wall biosynthesis